MGPSQRAATVCGIARVMAVGRRVSSPDMRNPHSRPGWVAMGMSVIGSRLDGGDYLLNFSTC